MLATVKVWPVDAGVRGKGGATANLDGVCARRQWPARPERTSARCSGIATLDKEEKTNGPLHRPSIAREHEATRRLILIAARQTGTPRSVLEKFSAVQMIDVIVPATDGREL